jgi:hypothetical protein
MSDTKVNKILRRMNHPGTPPAEKEACYQALVNMGYYRSRFNPPPAEKKPPPVVSFSESERYWEDYDAAVQATQRSQSQKATLARRRLQRIIAEQLRNNPQPAPGYREPSATTKENFDQQHQEQGFWGCLFFIFLAFILIKWLILN